MRVCVVAVSAALLALAAASRRTDQDFEFDDSKELEESPDADNGDSPARASRKYVYDPHNPLCRSLVCKKRQLCVLRDAFTALCASKKEITRAGDTLVSAGAEEARGEGEAGAAWGRDEDDDVFYDAGAKDDLDDLDDDNTPERCVGCAGGAAQFLCGSDNRTYSSLCRLDLHNCVRRARVRLACRGFCPCAGPSRARRLYTNYRKRRLETSHNEVLPERPSHRRQAQGCALDKMADRLLDWFGVLMEADAGGGAEERGGDAGERGGDAGERGGEAFPADCKPEVRWMFRHLDTDGDGLLSDDNLYALRHDDREKCLRPFLASCGGGRRGARGGRGGGGGRGAGGAAGRAAGGGVGRAAWCACLRRAARPCTALASAHPNPRPGAWVPACDAAGYYRARQCHAALGVCWCVDAHGAERPGSRTKGKPLCPETKLPVGVSGEAGAPDDDEDGAGSGDSDQLLRF